MGRNVKLAENVQQVSMAVLEVDEMKADAPGHLCRGDKAVDQPPQAVVRQHDRGLVGRDAEPGVQERMVVGDARLRPLEIAGPGETAAVGQLQSD
jgi:hypothetical protein